MTVSSGRAPRSAVTRTAARLRRLPLLVWVGALVIVLVGLTAALGGFAPAPDRGRPVEVGEEILLHRWRVHIDGAQLLDDTYENQARDPRIRLTVRLEFVGQESECCLNDGMLEVRYAGRTADHPNVAYIEPRRTGGFDPDVPTTQHFDFYLKTEDPLATPPDSVEVVVRDERPNRSPLWKSWVVSHAVASVQVPCPDERRRR
ncbi:MAG TPA: hypothetical protein VEX66_11625 [Microlunatus sp.]|nr:hypothetical protein [Microlunatus sp.]